MDLQAVTGQLYIQDGQVRHDTAVPGLLTQSAPAKAVRARERDFLFVHLTLTGQPDETAVLAQDLLDAVSRRYYQATGSVTAALRRALQDANELLLRLNLSGAGPAREGAMTCAVLRHGELYLLQAGEALAMLGHNFGIERLPARRPEQVTPIGRSAGLDIRYFHQRLLPGDMLLLADPRLAHLPTQDLEPALVDSEVEIGLDTLQEIVAEDSARLLLVEFTDEAPADLPELVTVAPRPESRLSDLPEPLPVRSADALPGVAAAATPGPTEAPVDAAPSAGADASGSPVSRAWRELPRPEIQLDVERTARQATSGAALGLSRFTGWLARLMAQLRPPPAPGEGGPRGWAWPALLAVIIPVVVAVVVSSVYLQRGRVRRVAEIKQELGQNLVLAEQAGDEVSSRAYYQAMLGLAAEADQLRPGDDEIASLRRQAVSALDALDGVVRLAARPFYTYGDEAQLTRVVLRPGFNGGIYVLDRTGQQVLQHDTDESYLNLLSEAPVQLTFSQQAIGNHIVGDIADIMWRARGNIVSRDGIAMLDRRGALLIFYPNFADTRAIPLGLASQWQAPVSMATFDERLYVLDVGARQIWKYYPDGEGFIVNDEDQVIALGPEADLGAAVDIDLYSEDASLLVAYGDGRLRYFDTRSGRIQWSEADLMQNGLVSPLVAPVTAKLVGRGLNASVFVADPGSGRIVQIGRSGTVLAQYRANDENGAELFSRITDFDVAEAPLRIFVTAQNVLYVATLE